MVDEKLIVNGNQLKDLTIPKHTLVIMVRRADTFFVPTGETELQLGDRLLVISDNNAEKVVQEMEEEEAQILTHWWMDFTRHTSKFIRVRWKKMIEEGRKKSAKTPQPAQQPKAEQPEQPKSEKTEQPKVKPAEEKEIIITKS